MRLLTVKCLKCGHVWKLSMTLRSVDGDLANMVVCPKCHRVIRILEDKLLDCVQGDNIGERITSGADYEEEHLRQREQQKKRKPLIVIEDDGEPFFDYVGRVFWKPYKKAIGVVLVFIITAFLMFTGLVSPILNAEYNPPDPSVPWWLFFFLWNG